MVMLEVLFGTLRRFMKLAKSLQTCVRQSWKYWPFSCFLVVPIDESINN